MSELVEDPAVLEERVLTTRAYLAAAGGQEPDAVEVRVAASITHLGLVARLVSPALATAVLGAGVPPLDLQTVHWQPVLGGAFPLSLVPPRMSGDLSNEFFDYVVPDLNAATQPFGVSEHILAGNVASAINGAATMISRALPQLARAVDEQAGRLLAHPAVSDEHTTADGHFRRRSCCLIYRAAPGHAGGLCGDCALTHS
jgi:hypothetical protein